jgi:hypothetical protein
MRYRVYGGDDKLIGTISTTGRVTEVSEGIGGIHALKTLIKVFPDGFYVRKDEQKQKRRWWR